MRKDWLLAYERLLAIFQGSGVERATIKYVKRFMAYHSSNFTEMAIAQGDLCKRDEFRAFMRKYQDEYIELNEELEEGYYVVWIYIPYEFIRLGDNFKYTLFFISQTEFKSKFVGIDKEFCTIRKLLIDHFKSQNEFEIASCNQFIISCPQDIHNNTNLSPFVMYNSTGANLEFNFDFSLTNGYTNLPPYKNQKTFSVILPPDGYDVIIRTRTGYVNLSLGYSVIPVFNSDLPPTVDYLNPENQMNPLMNMHL